MAKSCTGSLSFALEETKLVEYDSNYKRPMYQMQMAKKCILVVMLLPCLLDICSTICGWNSFTCLAVMYEHHFIASCNNMCIHIRARFILLRKKIDMVAYCSFLPVINIFFHKLDMSGQN